MKPICWLLCCGLLFTACRKKRQTGPGDPTTPTPAVASQPDAAVAAPAPSAPAPGTPPAAVSINYQHFNQLSEALLKFRRDKNRGPANWQELITTGYLKQMPDAPPGKQYVFDRSLNVQMVPAL